MIKFNFNMIRIFIHNFLHCEGANSYLGWTTRFLSPFLYQNLGWTIMREAGLEEAQLESRLPGEISVTSDMQMTPPLWQKVKKNKEPLDESERGEWKSWLKAQHSENKDHGIRSHHFMANRRGNSGNSGWLYFEGAPKSLQMVTVAMRLKDAYSLEGKLWPT